MNIGVCVVLDEMETLTEKLDTMRDQGFDTCQLVCWKPELWTKENAETVRQLFEQKQLNISAFWCGWDGPAVWNFYDGHETLGLLPVKYREMRVKNLCDGADFAKSLGVMDVITHMGFIPENPHDPQFVPFCDAVRRVALHLKENGQYLLFESGQETPVVMLRCFETVGTDNLGINLDTANLILYGKGNPVDALDVFGKYVRNLHAKDGNFPTNGHDLGEEKKIGEGSVDFRRLFEKLHALHYDSYITIECELEGDERIAGVLQAKQYLRRIIDEVYE